MYKQKKGRKKGTAQNINLTGINKKDEIPFYIEAPGFKGFLDKKSYMFYSEGFVLSNYYPTNVECAFQFL